ncbi:MAG TPA: DNA-primase RepB domain-containing protein [Roseiflexaceae bacterium]|nr:DNA-primase RepB domain-containing protein [Roseiflexaceae bacterium]
MSDDTFERFTTILHQGGARRYVHYLPQRRSLWYSTDEVLPVDPANAKTNLYFSVHPSTAIPPANAHGEVKESAWVRSQLRFIAAISCLFAEYDDKDYGGEAQIASHLDRLCVPSPSALIHSGGGVHAYWLLDEPYVLSSDDRREAAKHIQARWVDVVGGDKGAKDLCRVLRVPGSRNFKYDPPRTVRWLKADFDRRYPLRALTAHLPKETYRTVEPVRWAGGSADSIQTFNAAHDVGSVLASHGYAWHGNHKMLSPWSSTGQPGVTIDTDTNRAFVHHGSDPLCDGYWKRPFDVIRILDYDGDFQRTLKAVREGRQ